MTVEGGEAAADALTGAMVGRSVEPQAGGERASAPKAHAARAAVGEPQPACLNCGAALAGAYCASCGQSAHIHRSFRSLGHDILHSVFHFDGKFWRTIPELAFHPGRLTRRYIDGERAKFISPMALFLFAVFVMYGIFAFLPAADWEDPPPFTEGPMWSPEQDAFPSGGAPSIAPPGRVLGSDEVSEALRAQVEVIDVPAPPPVGPAPDTSAPDVTQPSAEGSSAQEPSAPSAESENVFTRAMARLEENPELVFYKMKSNGYKWSWLLVPLSIPFVWLLFFWRRDFPLYDHAVFVTYSISFMMVLLIVSTLGQVAGAPATVQGGLILLVPPLHLYKQLRGAYRLTRLGALVRLFFVLVAAATVLSAFVTMLLLIGALE